MSRIRPLTGSIRACRRRFAVMAAAGTLLVAGSAMPALAQETPSDAPTVAPTEAPTDAPTEAPTVAPTDAPTDVPTDVPTDAPTEAPTVAPTVESTVAPSVSVMPSAALADGQRVSIEAAGFPMNTTLRIAECASGAMEPADCDMFTAVLQGSDDSGALSVAYNVLRVIVTNNQGRLDCAVDACVLVVSTIGETTLASAPIAFENTELPPPKFHVALFAPHFLEQGGATLRGLLECDMTGEVNVWFRLSQNNSAGNPMVANSEMTVACTPGAEIRLFSDWLFAFEPGSAHGSVIASAGGQRDGEAGPVNILTFVEALDLLLPHINEPAVRAELTADFQFRIEHNPSWARYFIAALQKS